MVATAGKPSGTAAMASATPISSICQKSVTPRNQPATTMTAHSANTITMSRRPSCASFFSNGVARVVASSIRTPILPTSVRAPVSVTSNRPRPSVIVVPRKAILRRSPSAASSSRSGSAVLVTALDSPVRAASSICNRTHSTMRPSAGTRAPAARTIRSPGTNSAAGISFSVPSRITWATRTDCFCRADNARAAFHSVKKPMPAFRTMTTRMATASRISPMAKAIAVAPTSKATMRLWN